MKRFLKVMFGITLILLVLGAIALAICYMTIPDRTKQAVDIVIGYADKPLFIIGGSSITIGAVAFVLIRYAAKKFVDNYKKQLEDYGKGVDDKLLKAQQYRDSAKELFEKTTIILQGFSSQIEKVQNDLITLCETSPNAKIKALAVEFKTKTEELNKEIEHKLETTNNYLLNGKSEIDKVKEEFEKQINELTEQVERLVKQYEQREETTNG